MMIPQIGTPSAPTVKLVVKDKSRIEHKGWNKVEIKRSIHCLSGTFDLSLSPVWDKMPDDLQIRPGLTCELSIGEDVVITGFIDTVRTQIDKNQHTINVTGRDKVADLVDCSSLLEARTRQSIKFEEILTILCDEFQIPNKVWADTGAPFPSWAIGDESVFDNLARTAALRKLMIITDGQGSLIVTKPSSKPAKLLIDDTSQLLSIERTQDFLCRHSYYETRSQSFVETKGKDIHLKVLTSVKDPLIKRYRPLLVQQDGEVVEEIAKDRLNWEVATRKAKSERISVQLVSWLNPDKKLWNINETVNVDLPRLSIKNTYLIVSVDFSMDDHGMKTKLDLESLHSADIDPTLAAREYDQKKAADEDHVKLGGTQ